MSSQVTIAFDQLSVDDVGPVLEHRLTRTDLVRYAGASGDYNPMHHDEIKATAAGMPSTFGHGMLSMALLGRALTDWFGADALRSFRVRFAKQTWPGDVLRTHLVVTGTHRGDDGNLVEVLCELRNQDDVAVVTGTATARLEARP